MGRRFSDKLFLAKGRRVIFLDKEIIMLKWALIFLLIAIVAGANHVVWGNNLNN